MKCNHTVDFVLCCLAAGFLAAGCQGLDTSDKDACKSDADCLNGYFCSTAGRCLEERPCQNDGDCNNGAHCDPDGRCVPDECREDGDCGQGEYCSGNACVACTRNDECDPGFYCDLVVHECKEVVCTPDCTGQECGPDGCGGSCGSCSGGATCDADGQCVAAEECEAKGDCELGQLCVDGYCVTGCENGRDCPDGLDCYPEEGDHGLCAECLQDEDCPQGEYCAGNACVAGCNTDEDCPGGQVCDDQHRCCTPHDDTLCTDGLDYWVDSCGNTEELKETCEHGCNPHGPGCAPGGSTVLCPSGCTWEVEILGPICDYPLHYVCYGGSFDAELDADGNLHIAYVAGVVYSTQGSEGEVRYAHQTPTGFQSQVVEDLDQPGGEPSLFLGTDVTLAMESNGTPHVGYNTPAGPRYSRQPGGSWERVDMFDENATTMDTLMMDSLDRPHLTYRYYVSMADYGLRYLRWSGSDWEEVYRGGGLCQPQLLDAGGLPHAVCGNGGDLSYGHLSGASYETTYVWYSQTDDARVVEGPDGQPHIIFRHSPDGESGNWDLYYAAPDGNAFQVEQVPVPAKVGGGPGLAIDPEGRPHIAFRDYSQKVLWYGYKDAGTWHLQVVDDTQYHGNNHAVFIKPNGIPVIVYHDDDDMKVVTLVP